MVLAVLAAMSGSASVAAAQTGGGTESGHWRGTIEVSMSGTRTYAQWYTDTSLPENVYGSSSHSLHWRLRLDSEGTYKPADASGPASMQFGYGIEDRYSNARFELFQWTGSASIQGSGSGPDGVCQYQANGSFTTPIEGQVQVRQPDTLTRPPYIDTERYVQEGKEATGVVQTTRPADCQAGGMHGFQSLDRFDPLLVSDPPDPNRLKDQTTLCSYQDEYAEREWINPADRVTIVDGRTTLKVSGQSDCDGKHGYWFGDSTLYQTDDIDISYSYDLTFVPAPIVAACDDGTDDDGDGRTDFPGDPGCTSQDDTSELGAVQCDNGLDDDGNGHVDYRPDGSGDTGCESLTDDVEREMETCGDDRYTTRKDKAIEVLIGLPDIDWYRAKVTVRSCIQDGKAWITDMDLEPKIQGGPYPLLLREFGFVSLNPEDPEYSPIPARPGAVYASASTTYVMCWDPITFLTKVPVAKRQIKKRMEKPLSSALRKLLEKAGITKISKPVREQAIEKFKRQVDAQFRKGMIRAWLKKRHVPDRIASFAEKVAMKNRGPIKNYLKSTVAAAAGEGRYDGLPARKASEKMVNDAFRGIGNRTAFCGGRAPEKSNLRMWTVEYEAQRTGRKIEISKHDVYKHPILTVRSYGD